MTITLRIPKPATIIAAGFFLLSIWAFASAVAEVVVS